MLRVFSSFRRVARSTAMWRGTIDGTMNAYLLTKILQVALDLIFEILLGLFTTFEFALVKSLKILSERRKRQVIVRVDR